jgi:hypothetical protein
MAYVVARPKGRFEVRESVHTPKGPRARTLAGFDVLTGEVLAAATARAQRPFDANAVVESAIRAGAQVRMGTSPTSPADGATVKTLDAESEPDAAARRFVDASRRMAKSLRAKPHRQTSDPGDTLIDLLGFADEVARNQPPRTREPLLFPVLAQLVEARRSAADSRSR